MPITTPLPKTIGSVLSTKQGQTKDWKAMPLLLMMTCNLTSDSEGKIQTIKWTVYGKVEQVTKTVVPGQPQKTIKYRYDGTGNRAVKMLYTNANTLFKTTYYFRDASVNVMGIYEQAASQTEQTLIEQPIYGSSRIGIYKAPDTGSKQFEVTLGYKQYELSNHFIKKHQTLTKFGAF